MPDSRSQQENSLNTHVPQLMSHLQCQFDHVASKVDALAVNLKEDIEALKNKLNEEQGDSKSESRRVRHVLKDLKIAISSAPCVIGGSLTALGGAFSEKDDNNDVTGM